MCNQFNLSRMLSTSTITVEAKIVCPIEFHDKTLTECRLQELSSATIKIIDENDDSPGFVWCGCKWAWQDFENNRTGTAVSKEDAIAQLTESLRSASSIDILFNPEVLVKDPDEEDVIDFEYFN